MTVAPKQEQEQQTALCVGILGSDPLRLIGLQAILEESLLLKTMLLAEGGMSKSGRPQVVMVDAGLHDNSSLGESVEHIHAEGA